LDQFILQARQKKNWMFGITERLDLTYDPRSLMSLFAASLLEVVHSESFFFPGLLPTCV